MHRRASAILFAMLMVLSADATAFDYLEHSFFTDYACGRAQRHLAAHLAASGEVDDELLGRYLALALVCPVRTDASYCAGGTKMATALVNELESPPEASGDYAITLGDYSALPDHVSRFGPIKGLPRAGTNGLVSRTLRWLVHSPTSAGGAIEDVAEDACETEGLTDLDRVIRDAEATLARWEHQAHADGVPKPYLSELARAPVLQGPSDPPMKYSFDNPHYLDLVLRNHAHFGEEAYASWSGFHSAAIQIAQRRCVDVLATDADEAESLADDTPGFDAIDFEELSPDEIDARTCRLIGYHVRRRLLRWAHRADPKLVEPVAGVLEELRANPLPPDRLVLLDRVTTSLLALVFEGAGLHFLQDGLAAGHMRTIRSREALVEVRYDHDRDNAEGVVALFRTRQGTFAFVAFGDGRLLSRPHPASSDCAWPQNPTGVDPRNVTNCLVRHQRGVLVGATSASILDWSLGGTMDRVHASQTCDTLDSLEKLVCIGLPVRPTSVAGQALASAPEPSTFYQGTLPVPPPPFSYESIDMRFGIDLPSSSPHLGIQLTMLSELDQPAHWLTSYQLGMNALLGSEAREQLFADFSYGFHYRFYARVMLDLAPYAFAGMRNEPGDRAFFAGVGPSLGITALPEGWIKMPLEFSISYRMPVVLYGSDTGFFGPGTFDGHRLQLGIGLAFMH